MKRRSIEETIREAFEAVTPEMKAELLSDVKKQKAKGKVLKMPETNNKNKKHWWMLAAAAALLLIVGAGFALKGVLAPGNAAVASVMIDVNPSIELSVNRNDRVLEAAARNADGAEVLSDMDLTGSDVKVAVNAIVGSMLQKGYLNELANSVLISVESADDGVGTRLRDTLGVDLRDLMGGNPFGCAVLSQAIEPDAGVSTLAEEYNVTRSKAQLISKLVAANPSYDFGTLAALSINELGVLLGNNAVENLRAYGSSSEMAFIGADRALEIALAHAGAEAAEASGVEVELDCEHGSMIYEVEFKANGLEYDYDIDAVTGEILKHESEPADGPAPTQDGSAPAATPKPTAQPLISSERALEIALGHAGVDRSEAKDIEIELGREDGRPVYEVEFKANGVEYDYDIDAETGAVLDHDSEEHHASSPTAKPTSKPTEKPSGYIGGRAALRIALEDAGVTSSQAQDVDVELETKNGVKVYDIDFEAGGYEYDYVIDAVTGDIIDKSREKEDGGHGGSASAPQTELIGEARAWEIALARAGLTMSETNDRSIELETDNGVRCYELEFASGGWEYEVKINAVTGAVLKFERERD
ncbi:MAG: PepSY domain-containing protein [Clostridia bacterium]|nr:PepSY domain-containing protein [Clostridia bacterium]